jgi:hypothetical protein
VTTLADVVDAGLVDRSKLPPELLPAAAQSSDPIAGFGAAIGSNDPMTMLQAAGGNPSLQAGIIGRFDIPNAGAMTFENPFRHRINEALVLGAFEVISGLGGARFGAQNPRQLTWQDPQTNFPRGIERIYVPGTEPPPPNRLPVPYEPPPQPGPFAFGIGGIGAILGGIIAGMWEGWPNALDPELGPYDTRAPAGAPEVILSGPGEADVLAGPTDIQGPPSTIGDNPPAPPFPDFGGGPSQDALPEDVGMGPVPDQGPPQGARQPAPAPVPTARTIPPWVWPAIGGAAAISLGRAGRTRSSTTLPSISVLPSPGLGAAEIADLVESLLPTSTSSLTSSTTRDYMQTATGGVWDVAGGDDGCNCEKRSGKKRKCLAKAQLTWRSGPKKGRPAGTKCYRFAN